MRRLGSITAVLLGVSSAFLLLAAMIHTLGSTDLPLAQRDYRLGWEMFWGAAGCALAAIALGAAVDS